MNIREICQRIISLYEAPTISSQDRSLSYQLVAKLRVGIDPDAFILEDLKAILERV